MPPEITCRLTGTRGPGVKAHIIPKSFYPLPSGDNDEPMTVFQAGTHPQATRSWIGEYDSTIVTKEGEAYFSEWDAYAHKFLLERTNPAVLHHADNVPMCVEVAENDYEKIKLFFISLLWRAGVSNRPMFSDVALGPHEERLRRRILNGQAGDHQYYGVLLYLFQDTPPQGFPIEGPRFLRDRDSQCAFYDFKLGRLGAWVKIASHPCRSELSDFFLRKNQPVRFIVRDPYRESKTYRQMAASLRQFYGRNELPA